jgi:DNA-binding response OmpR family regulator
VTAERKHKILIVEDEEDLRKGLALNLENEGFEVVQADRGDTGLDQGVKEEISLILLDVMLPGMSGFDVCRELRKKGIETPIIMLTARSEEIDRVVGLELGADDYVSKPFSVRELVARIHARLRRAPDSKSQTLVQYRFGEVEIDFEKFQATRNGEVLDLTTRELDILKLLIRRRGEVVTRDQMLDELWGYDAYPTTRTVDNHILKLRKKVEEDPANPQYILSIYGTGYKFVG